MGEEFCDRVIPIFDRSSLGSEGLVAADGITVIMSVAQNGAKAPTAFISYSWDSEAHKEWVRNLASRLRQDGVGVTLDRWATQPGDQLPKFMETSVRENDSVLIVCTPNYKVKSDARLGGVGYEGDIMTGEVFAGKDPRKFIPLLRSGDWKDATPSWLSGKYGVDLRGDPYRDVQYEDLLNTLHGTREPAPPLGVRQPLRSSVADSGQSGLSASALDLLLAAARGDGTIITFQQDAGLAVIANDKRFDEPGNPRLEARNRHDLQQLVARGFGHRESDEVFKLTQKGYELADRVALAQPGAARAPSGAEPIKIIGIIANEVGTPRLDGSRGSALYEVPFQLSAQPSPEWAELFRRVWDRPPSWSTRHRPGIGRVEGDRIILDGTTVEEVAQVHRDTLKLVVEEVNRIVAEHEVKQRGENERQSELLRGHKESVKDAAKRISFD